MKNSILRLGSFTILVSLALICVAQVMSIAIANGTSSQGPDKGFGPPFPPGHGLLPEAPGTPRAGGPPRLLGIGRHGSADAWSKLVFSNADSSSIFREAAMYNSGGADAYSIAVADVNGDGHPDLLVANSCGSICANGGGVGVLLGNGDGTFQAAVSYSSGGYAADSIAVADVNGDGYPDVLVTNRCASSSCTNGGSIGVLLGNGDGTFQAAVSYNSGAERPFSAAVADVNGDGKPDLLVANQCAGNGSCTNGVVSVLLGNGDGTFQTAVSYNSGGYESYSIAVADVNGDGHPDLLVANECGSSATCSNGGTVSVLLGNGDGTFQAAASYSSGGYAAYSIAAADVNGDGYPDLLVANDCAAGGNCSNGVVGVLLGNGDGTFQAAVTYNSGGYYADSIAVRDVNADGHPDLLVANQCFDSMCADSGIGVLLGNGDGTFQSAVSYNSGGENPLSIAVADVDGDGHPDLLVGNECVGNGSCTNGVISVLLGNGDGTFQAAVNYNSSGYDAYSIAVADVNGDGKPDLLVANYCASSCSNGGGISVLLGNGDGTFQAPITYDSGGEYALSIAVADVNGDGHLDLLVANECASSGNCLSGGVVGVLLGNGDGTFQAAVSYNSGGEYAYSIAVADVNGDGHPDLLVASQCASSCSNGGGISVLLGNGDG
ncbi:MAG: VCBS repeat-containing protein, partial [Terriglobales bacterium]